MSARVVSHILFNKQWEHVSWALDQGGRNMRGCHDFQHWGSSLHLLSATSSSAMMMSYSSWETWVLENTRVTPRQRTGNILDARLPWWLVLQNSLWSLLWHLSFLAQSTLPALELLVNMTGHLVRRWHWLVVPWRRELPETEDHKDPSFLESLAKLWWLFASGVIQGILCKCERDPVQEI